MRGDALSCVIIDKLPFTSPDDPLLKARIEDCRLRGGDPFNDVQLPDAVITLKQGVGRLIRDIDDRGVLVICDNRLVMRPYGAMFLNSLPRHPGHGIWRKPSPFSSSAIKSKKSGVCYYARPVNTYLFPAEVGMSTRILAIDTATEACSVALWNNGEVQALFELCPENIPSVFYRWYSRFWHHQACRFSNWMRWLLAAAPAVLPACVSALVLGRGLH